MVKGGHVIFGVVVCVGIYSIIGGITYKRMRWAGHLIHKGEQRNVYKLLVEKHEGKTVSGRPRCTCEVG